MMFDSFEAYDVQETRRVSREEGEQLYLIKQIHLEYGIKICYNENIIKGRRTSNEKNH